MRAGLQGLGAGALGLALTALAACATSSDEGGRPVRPSPSEAAMESCPECEMPGEATVDEEMAE